MTRSERIFDKFEYARLLVGMFIKKRKHLLIPDNFAEKEKKSSIFIPMFCSFAD